MKLVKHLTGYLPVSLANGLVGFGSVYVFTRLLGADDYGRYALMFSTMVLIHTMTLTWAEAGSYRFASIAAEEKKLPAHYRTGLRLLSRGIFVMAVVAALAWWFKFRADPAYSAIMPWLIATMLVNAVGQLALEAHRAHQRVGRYALVETSRVVFGFLIGALLAWQSGLGPASPFVGMFAAATVIALHEGVWLLRQSRGGEVNPKRSREWMAYGIPIAAAIALDVILSVADRFLIEHFIDVAAVGAYAAGYGVADKTVLMICAWAAMAGSPLIMAAFEEDGKAAASEAARGLFGTILFLGLPAAVGLGLVADPLSEAMISEDLRQQAAEIIPWIAVAGLLNGFLIHYVSESFQLVRRTDQRALLMIIPAVVNIILNILLLPTLGLMGAVYATVASYGLGIVLLGAVGRRHVALPVPIGEIIKVGLASFAMWPVISVLPDWGSWPELLVKAAAGGLTYLSVALALNAGNARTMLLNKQNRQGPADA
jgi:O-antigen/teichoic acid export membrane protein